MAAEPSLGVEACLFDYGNTIVAFDQDQIRSVLERLERFLRQSFAPIDIERLRVASLVAYSTPHLGDPPSYVEPDPVEQMEFVLRHAYGEVAEFTRDLCSAANDVLQDAFVASISIDPSAREALLRIGERCRVGLVSNYPCGATIRRSLEKEGIIELLDPIVVSGDIGYVKPHAAPFRAALDALGVAPGSVLFIGDRWEMDVVGAKELGMRACHLVGLSSETDWDDRYERVRPDRTVRTLRDVPDLLE